MVHQCCPKYRAATPHPAAPFLGVADGKVGGRARLCVRACARACTAPRRLTTSMLVAYRESETAFVRPAEVPIIDKVDRLGRQKMVWPQLAAACTRRDFLAPAGPSSQEQTWHTIRLHNEVSYAGKSRSTKRATVSDTWPCRCGSVATHTVYDKRRCAWPGGRPCRAIRWECMCCVDQGLIRPIRNLWRCAIKGESGHQQCSACCGGCDLLQLSSVRCPSALPFCTILMYRGCRRRRSRP